MIKNTPLCKALLVVCLLMLPTTCIFSSNFDSSNFFIDEKQCLQHNEGLQDAAIEYTLTDDDYALVGNDGFGNFDIREGYDDETVTVRLAKINKILLHNFPDYKKGQEVAVSYKVWKPGDDVFVMNVIHDGAKYILKQ